MNAIISFAVSLGLISLCILLILLIASWSIMVLNVAICALIDLRETFKSLCDPDYNNE